MHNLHLYIYVHVFSKFALLHPLDYNLLSSTNSVSASGWCLADKILPTRKSIRETSGSELLGGSEFIVRRTSSSQQPQHTHCTYMLSYVLVSNLLKSKFHVKRLRIKSGRGWTLELKERLCCLQSCIG